MQFSKIEETSLSDATRPLLMVSRLAGISPKSHWHKIYTVFILVNELLILCGIWWYYLQRNAKNRYFNIFVHALQDSCRMISLFVILGIGLFDRQRFIIPIKDFENIDQSLKRLGGCLNNRGSYRSEMLLLVCVGLTPLIFWVVDYSQQLSITVAHMHLLFFIGWFHNMTIMITCALVDCSFSSTLSIITKRFRAINLIIHRAGTHGSHLKINVLEVSRMYPQNDVLKDLKILRKQYHDLWKIANRVNEAYGLHLLVGVTTSLAIITSKLCEVYYLFLIPNSNPFYHAGSMSWALFCIVRIFLLAKACQSTVTEAKATFLVLQEFGMKEDHSLQTKAEIRDFLMQVHFEAGHFTACGFFNVDFTLVCAILGAACTYLVILIQMGNSNACPITHFANESIHFDNEARYHK